MALPHILYVELILQITQGFHHSQNNALLFHICNLCQHISLFLECPWVYLSQQFLRLISSIVSY